MRSWNPNTDNKSEMILLPLSLYDEMTTKGTGSVVLELLFDVGLIEGELAGKWRFAINCNKWKIYLTGEHY